MADEGVCAVAQVVLHGKEQLVVVRPVEGLLVMSVLHYESDLKKPSAFEDDITDGQFSKEELQLAKTLVEQTTTEELSLDDYKDLYTERLRNLVEAKVEGKEIVTSPADEGPPVINLMEALKQSVKQSKDAAPKKAAKKGAKKKVARSAKTRKTPAKKKKSG